MQPLPPPRTGQSATTEARDHPQSSNPTSNPRPNLATIQEPNPQDSRTLSVSTNPAKKRKHRGGKKRKNRRQSFAAPPSETSAIDQSAMETFVEPNEHSPVRPGESFYKRRHNRSDESIDSDVLLDHRHQAPMRQRRESRLNVVAAQRAGMNASQTSQRSDRNNSRHHQRRRTGEREQDNSDNEPDDRTPLINPVGQHKSPTATGYGIFRSNTGNSSHSSIRKRTRSSGGMGQSYARSPDYDINNPPSVPSSPHLNASMDDPMLPDTNFLSRSPDSRRNLRQLTGDLLIDIDGEDADDIQPNSAPPSPRLGPDGLRHKRAMTFGAGGVDVCFPSEVMSEMGEDDFNRIESRDDGNVYSRRHRRKREWPLLWVLDEWSREEKEDRAADFQRAQRVREPVMVEGRLRPSRVSAWHREANDAPYRFTYFNEEFEGTIHAQTISELVPQKSSFRELFIPDPPLLEESSESESEDEALSMQVPDGAKTTGMISPKAQADENGSILSRLNTQQPVGHQRSRSQEPSRLNSILSQGIKPPSRDPSRARSAQNSGEQTPQPTPNVVKQPKKPKYGPRPTFWLDVMCPTPQEMQVITSAFGIHPLTHEDIIVQEAREKVELFKNYYFINYRTFDQDPDSENYLEPINMYIVVFRYGILTFHFSQIPHPANVRRRIRQLTQHLILSADWISYAIIDDITDAYGPMIHGIEEEVDDIDEAILKSTPGAFTMSGKDEKKDEKSGSDDRSSTFKMPWGEDPEKRKDTSGYDMLRRVGETRKKVMSLYRLLGNKADVIKGFAKRCNEQWDVAPKTEIGLYLGDIQDHILTMTSNLSHYETLLSRAHSNYLAQVSTMHSFLYDEY